MKYFTAFYIIDCFTIHFMLFVNGNETVVPKVVGGKPVNLEKYPHAARFYNDENMCAGVILNSCCVLTSAHCMDINDDKKKMAVVVGSQTLADQRGQWFSIIDFTIHERYNTTIPFECDIALIFLDEKIKFSKTVQKAILVHHGEWMSPKEKDFEVSGWGYTMHKGTVSLELLMAQMEFVDKKVCQKMHGIKLTEDFFCLYGNGQRDACNGDSGSGAMWHGMVVGLVSHGKGGCGKVNAPTMLANVWYLRDWIRNRVESFINNCNDARFCQSRIDS